MVRDAILVRYRAGEGQGGVLQDPGRLGGQGHSYGVHVGGKHPKAGPPSFLVWMAVVFMPDMTKMENGYFTLFISNIRGKI